MSTPHIAWAFAQRNLTAAQRVVLIALAERANGERTCFPSEETLAGDCELSRRSVIAAVQYLRDDRGLIEVVTDPAERAAILAKAGARKSARSNVYRILRPADGAKSAHSDTGNGAKSAHNRMDGAKSAHLGRSDGAKSSIRECKICTSDSAGNAHESLTESLNEKKREDFAAGKGSGTPPPSPPAQSSATVGSTCLEADDPLDRPVDPAAFQSLIASLSRGFQNNYPPRAAALSPEEMIEVCAGKPPVKPLYAPDAYLRQQRAELAARAAATMGRAP